MRLRPRLNAASNDRQWDDHPRELDLAHEVLAVHDTAHRAGRRLGEEGEEDDRAEQLGTVEYCSLGRPGPCPRATP